MPFMGRTEQKEGQKEQKAQDLLYEFEMGFTFLEFYLTL